jgi:bifunctional non-homologous end joining protein LigD
MLTHVSDRPLSVLRCPDGNGKQTFFQKHVSAGLPSSVHTVSIANKKTGKREEFLTLNSAEQGRDPKRFPKPTALAVTDRKAIQRR